MAGLFLAAASVGMAHYTGNVVYDALGSITIGGKDLVHRLVQLSTVDSLLLNRA